MLQEPDVAGHQSWSREADDLPEWKIPRHHRQDGSKGLVADVTPASGRLDYFIEEKALCIFSIVPTCPCAFDGLIHASPKRLPHFHRHQSAESFFLCVQNVGSLDHHSRSFGEWHLAVFGKRVDCASKFLVDLRVQQLLECFQE